MNGIYLFVLCLFISPISIGQTIVDNFDDYNTNAYLGTESDGLWTTWYNNPGGEEDAFISDEVARSAPNSIKINNDGVDTIDVVLPLGNRSSGSWSLSFWMYVKPGHGGYFNVLHAFEPNASNWAIQAWFDKTGYGYMTVGGGVQNNNFFHPRGAWFNVTLKVNIDENLGLLSVNEKEIAHWAWSEGSMNQTPTSNSNLAALSFVSAAKSGSEPSFFIDDVSFTGQEIGLKNIHNKPQIYPNPSNGLFSIENENLENIEVYSILGEKILTTDCFQKCQISTLKWSKGTYLLRLKYKNGNLGYSKLIVK